jgi:hypothetical protein
MGVELRTHGNGRNFGGISNGRVEHDRIRK